MSSIDTCEKCGEDYNIKTVHQCLGKMSIENLKKHFKGATYELTQENMNNLIAQLEDALSELQTLKPIKDVPVNYETNEQYDSKDIHLKKDNQIVGLHAIGYKGPYNYTVSDIDGTVKEVETDFKEIEKWGNEYDENYNILGRGSFRVFDISIEDTAKGMEADGWVRFERTPHE